MKNFGKFLLPCFIVIGVAIITMKCDDSFLNRAGEPKFHYMDKIEYTGGFYKGRKGIILAYYGWGQYGVSVEEDTHSFHTDVNAKENEMKLLENKNK